MKVEIKNRFTGKVSDINLVTRDINTLSRTDLIKVIYLAAYAGKHRCKVTIPLWTATIRPLPLPHKILYNSLIYKPNIMD